MAMAVRLLLQARGIKPIIRETLHTRHYSCGLFGRRVLTSPEGFKQATDETTEQANVMVEKILKSTDPRQTVVLFDELSNALCRTADLAECVRLLHPKEEYVQQAQNCCIEVSTFVEKLNTNKSLFNALKNVIDSSNYSNLERDTKRNVSSLMHDFEISGIHLSDGEREKVVALNEIIVSRNHAFVSNCNSPLYVRKTDAPAELMQYFAVDGEHIVIDHIPHSCAKESIRELCYRFYHLVSAPQSKLLEELLAAKFELASVVGYESFAHRTLKDSMAGTPEVVLEFLNALSDKLRPLAEEEAREALKSEASETNQLLPWNVPWLNKQVKQKYLNHLSLKDIKDFFPLDSCMAGVDMLFSSLFNVNLKEEMVKEGEVWDSSVKKYSFVEAANNQTLGHLYCDLHYRPTKLQSDCQFTIQGCRRQQDGSYQMPISALNLCLPIGESPCLSQLAVENLFHEMGHAAHSVLGRTRYQNLSGTRCPTDYAEVPSNLMELFLQDERVLKSFARNNSTGRMISDEHAVAFRLTSNVFPALSAQTQILLAIMDQVFHSANPLQRTPVEIFTDLHKHYTPIEYIQGTASFLRFTHLATYAGKYYSYMWSRAVANLIWRKCFKEDPFSQKMGLLYKEEMLAHGGGECPNVLVKNLLGYQPSIQELVDSYYQEIVELKEKLHYMSLH